jgi:hypothetical protein
MNKPDDWRAALVTFASLRLVPADSSRHKILDKPE